MTMTQKQELAEKIQVADGDTLAKAIQIIQVNTGLGGVSWPLRHHGFRTGQGLIK